MDNALIEKEFNALKAAACQGNEHAQSILSLCYLEGKVVKKDYDEAFKWCSLAIDGYNSNRFYMEDGYERADEVKANLEKIFRAFFAAAKQGNVSAQYAVGCFYCYGWGVKRDALTAKEWFLKAARKKHEPAMSAMFELY